MDTFPARRMRKFSHDNVECRECQDLTTFSFRLLILFTNISQTNKTTVEISSGANQFKPTWNYKLIEASRLLTVNTLSTKLNFKWLLWNDLSAQFITLVHIPYLSTVTSLNCLWMMLAGNYNWNLYQTSFHSQETTN